MAKRKPAPPGRTRSQQRVTVDGVLKTSDERYILRASVFADLKHPRKSSKPTHRYYHKKGSDTWTTVTYTKTKRIVSRVIYVDPPGPIGTKEERDAFNGVLRRRFDKEEKRFRKMKTRGLEFAGSVQEFHGEVQKKKRGQWHGTLTDESVALKSSKFRSIKKATTRHTSTQQQNAMMAESNRLHDRGAEYTIKRYRREGGKVKVERSTDDESGE